MNPSSNLLKLIVAALCVIGLFVCAMMKHYLPDVDLADVRLVLFAGLTATGVWHAATSPAAAGGGQSGRASLSFVTIVTAAAVALCLMAGCTTTTGSMYAGLATQAKAGIQVFDDNALHTARDIICAQPYSAIQRNADMQPGIQKLCGPLGTSGALDAGQLEALMSIIGKAQAAGLLAVPPVAK